MRSLASLKIGVTVVGLAAGLLLCPASRAQSEIAPDHFDGTDSWEAAAHHKLAGSNSRQQGLATGTNRHKPSPRAALQLTGHRQIRMRPDHGTSPMYVRRKVAARNSKKY